jgi:predicted glycosyltransferase
MDLDIFNNKKVLFVFSDPGGAKPCLSIADRINSQSLQVFSDREYSFYSDFSSKVNLLEVDEEIEKYIDFFNPDIIFTGTSYTSTIEKKVISLAKSKGIIVFSFVDHWTSISDRFSFNNVGFNFPDEVWVLDERAKQIAIKEGIDEDKLFVSGNPYHNWLTKWRPEIERKDFYKSLGLNAGEKHILFAPDPLSNVNGIESFGFDEYIASKRMIECVESSTVEFKNSHHFLIKMHPNQSVDKIMGLFHGYKNFTVLPLEIGTNESIYFADLVIGFFSSLLIEAALMNKPVIRFLQNELKVDPFSGLDLGTISNSDNLIKNIVKYSL